MPVNQLPNTAALGVAFELRDRGSDSSFHRQSVAVASSELASDARDSFDASESLEAVEIEQRRTNCCPFSLYQSVRTVARDVVGWNGVARAKVEMIAPVASCRLP